MSLESDGGMILTGENRRTRRKTCPSATMSTTNPTWIDPGVNTRLRGERPATNDLRYGTAKLNTKFGVIFSPYTALQPGSGHDLHCEVSLLLLDTWQDSVGRVISSSQTPLPTYGNKTYKHKDPCPERNSNPRSQQPSGQDLRLRQHGHRDYQL
jgi:hypothetical protein